MLQNTAPCRKSASWPQNISEGNVSSSALATRDASLQIPSFLQLLRHPRVFAHFWQGAESIAPAMQNHILTSKSGLRQSIFNTFDFQMCCAPRGVHFFDISSSKNDPNVWCFTILTRKRALCHNGVHFFNRWTSKTAPALRCFEHFYFESISGSKSVPARGVMTPFQLRNVLRATAACTFLTLQLPKVLREWGVFSLHAGSGTRAHPEKRQSRKAAMERSSRKAAKPQSRHGTLKPQSRKAARPPWNAQAAKPQSRKAAKPPWNTWNALQCWEIFGCSCQLQGRVQQCPGLFWRFTGVRPCGPRQDGCRLQGSVSYNKPVTCVAVIFEHFARRLAKHEYDIVVGRKCRLHRSQPALFWFHSRQFFGRPSSRSSLLWHLAPNCKSTGHVHLRGSRPGWVMHGCPSWTDRDKVSQPYISDLGWIDGATLQGFGQTRWSHPFISLPVCGGAMGQWSERWSYISSRPQFLPGYHSARPQRREAFRRVVQACIKDTILVGAPRQTSCRCRRLQLRTPGYSWCSGLCYRAVRGSELRGSTWWSQRGDLLRAAEFRKAASVSCEAQWKARWRSAGQVRSWDFQTTMLIHTIPPFLNFPLWSCVRVTCVSDPRKRLPSERRRSRNDRGRKIAGVGLQRDLRA